MALGKMLNLGGIDNRPPKANQTPGKFRVARNVYPTPDGRIIPRYHWSEPSGQPSAIKCYHHMTQYNLDLLSVVSEDTLGFGPGGEIYRIYKNNLPVPMSSPLGASPFSAPMTIDYPQSVQSYRRNNTTYFLCPYDGTLAKYDGVEASYAGCRQPRLSSTSYNPVGTKYIRVVQHRLDFDNNEPISEFVQFPVLAATTSVAVRVDGGATNIISLTGTPATIIPSKTDNDSYFKGATASYSAVNNDFTITTSDTNINGQIRVGSYVFTEIQTYNTAAYGLPAAASGLGLALRVKSVLPLVLDALNVKYLDFNREWQDTAFTNGALYAPFLVEGTRNIFSYWASSAVNGVYNLMSYSPAFPDSTTSRIYNVSVPNPPSTAIATSGAIVTLFSTLAELMDVTVRKLNPNSVYAFGPNLPLTSMTVYQDLLLVASDDLIWLSDTTLGGAFEQFNTSNVIRVGDSEYGRITSICGTQDFFVVCRERKNYYVNGNIATGNYRVQEITGAEIGAWSNSASILIKDTAIFINALGVFQVSDGGRCVRITETCPKNFATYDVVNTNEDVSFRLQTFLADPTSPSQLPIEYTANGLSVAYDEYRELLVFMKKGVAGNAAFVLHTKTGEAYEWDGLMEYSSSQKANCLTFINARYYFGGITTDFTYNVKYVKEDQSAALSYVTSYPVKLYTSWLTAGEPSLEKSLLQLKMFGRFDSNGTTSSVKICHYKDWDINTKVTNSDYFPLNTSLALNDQVQYSHKKRLNSDKVLSASVGMEIQATGVLFELESIEVEFNSIQEGMKK
jgi:hypothetical protein